MEEPQAPSLDPETVQRIADLAQRTAEREVAARQRRRAGLSIAPAMPQNPEFQIARFMMMWSVAEWQRTGPDAVDEQIANLREQWPGESDHVLALACAMADFLRRRRMDCPEELALLHVGIFTGIDEAEWAQARAYALSRVTPRI